MSQSRLARALLAFLTLAAALPLLAQTAAPAATPPFPYGRYTLQAIDPAHAPPAGLVLEFTASALKVSSGGQEVESHGMAVDGATWEVFDLDGRCTEPGDYHWHLDGRVLWMELVSDPCEDRARSITSMRFLPAE
jgi:hypothetical protein